MADMEGCLPGGTRPNTPHHHMGLWLQATVQMRLCRGCAQGGVWWKRVGGRAGARQGRTAQNSGRMFVFAATLVPRRRDIRHGNVGERENLNPGNHRVACRQFLSTKTQFLPLRAVFAKRSSLRGRTKVAKVGPLRARVKSAKVRPTPYA